MSQFYHASRSQLQTNLSELKKEKKNEQRKCSTLHTHTYIHIHMYIYVYTVCTYHNSSSLSGGASTQLFSSFVGVCFPSSFFFLFSGYICVHSIHSHCISHFSSLDGHYFQIDRASNTKERVTPCLDENRPAYNRIYAIEYICY